MTLAKSYYKQIRKPFHASIMEQSFVHLRRLTTLTYSSESKVYDGSLDLGDFII